MSVAESPFSGMGGGGGGLSCFSSCINKRIRLLIPVIFTMSTLIHHLGPKTTMPAQKSDKFLDNKSGTTAYR